MELNVSPNIFWKLLLVVLLFTKVHAEEDSLRSALSAIDRRQRDLTDYPSRYDDLEYGYPMERPEDLAFLKAASTYDSNDRGYDNTPEQSILDYLDDESTDSDDVKKRISSSFRERLEEDKQKHLEELAQTILNDLENDVGAYTNANDPDYDDLVREMYNQYQEQQYEREKNYMSNDMNKRYYYPKFGLDSAGLRKRSRYFNPDGPDESLYMLNYVPRDEMFNRLQEDNNDDDIDPNFIKKYFQRDRKYRQGSYSQVKRFPVTKRSSDYPNDDDNNRSIPLKKQKTDPKVEKDLMTIFGSKSQVSTTKKPDAAKSTERQPNRKPKTTTRPHRERPSRPYISNEESTNEIPGEKPLQIKKKSIDWSDYFGLDRRKKSEPKNDDIDKQWLMERYHQAISMANKRNAEYPLQSFHNHDQPNKKDSSLTSKPKNPAPLTPEEKKIKDMDSKLKTMEDTIVDDALKYTGAHEGATDSKEIQEVKSRILSRLAAAYSLEKMRTALDGDDILSEEKRTSVPRKQAVDEDREGIPEGDNNIKCAQGSEDCQEQNYRTPADLLEYHFGNGECPAIQKACNEVGHIIGQYGHVFESACSLHQMCLLCSNNNWFSPTRQCNVLFLEKAYELCKGKTDCQKDAQRAVRYLLDVNQSLQSQPLLADECELACPSDADMSELADSR